jgi:ERCC4-type nuclease
MSASRSDRGTVAIPRLCKLDPPLPMPLLLLVDTREQAPLTDHFPPWIGKDKRPVIAAPATLRTADYTSHPLQDLAIIERKSPADFMGTLYGDNRERWERELERVAAYELVSIVVEGERSDCAQASPGVNWRAVEADIADLRVRHGVDVAFKQGRLQAAYYVARWLWAAERQLLPRTTPAERLRDAANGLGLSDDRVSKGLRELVAREHLSDRFEAVFRKSCKGEK